MRKLKPKHQLTQSDRFAISKMDKDALHACIADNKDHIWHADEALMCGTIAKAEAEQIKNKAEEMILFCRGRLIALDIMEGWK